MIRIPMYIGHLASMDMIPRKGWTDIPADSSNVESFKDRADYVIYTHTADTGKCHGIVECCAQLRNIQHMHINVRRE